MEIRKFSATLFSKYLFLLENNKISGKRSGKICGFGGIRTDTPAVPADLY